MSAPEISAEAVKGVLAGQRLASFEDICQSLDIPRADWQGRARVRNYLHVMVKSGQVSLTAGAPLYRLERSRHRVQEKLWRAIILKARKAEAWCYADVARLAGCSLDYAKKYAEFLEGRELVVHAGVEFHTLFFRLAPGLEQLTAPVWNRRAEKRRRQ
jgi:hypothetical protein